MGLYLPGHLGNAMYWASSAQNNGWLVNTIQVTEMNLVAPGVQDTRTITPAFNVSGLQYIHMNP